MEFGLSNQSVVLQDPMCNGTELSLITCPGFDLGNVTTYVCLSGQNQAGVYCTRRCTDRDVRLANEVWSFTSEGYYFHGGTVEVCHDGIYGAICDIGWNQRAAQLTCNQLGFSSYVARPTFGSYFGEYDGIILFQNSTCDTPMNCTALPVYDPDCTTNRTAGVMCINVPRPCSDGDIQFGNPIYFGIFEGYNFDGGRVEVCINGTFRPVCDADWSNQDASVVCNGLAISFNRIRGQATLNATFGMSGEQPVLLDLMCNGTETNLSECRGYNLGPVSEDYCQGGLNQVGVRCLQVSTQCSFEGSIQLSAIVYESTPDISYSATARVDFCYNQTLAGICDVGWDENDAAVVCRSSFDGRYLSEVVTGLDYGPTTPVLENVSCNGSELSFEECQRSQPGQVDSQCLAQNRAAGVLCYQVCYDGQVRLAGGDHRAIGRVEVCQSNEWGTICNLSWDDYDADVACKSAGFYWGGVAVENVVFGSTNASILASNVSCNGSDYVLGDCRNTTDIPAICTHELDAAAYCQPGLIDMNIVVDRSTSLMAGNNVTIWCNAQSPSVANFSSFAWVNSRGVIVPDSPRINITIHNASYSDYQGQFIFNSSLTYAPLLPTDGDLHMCNLTIRLPRVGTNISNTTTRAIRVEVQGPIVNVNTVGMDIVGRSLTTTCTAQFFPGLPLEAVRMRVISVNLNSELVNFPPRLLYGDIEQVNETHFQRQVTTDPLEVTYTGRYTCSVGLRSDYIFTVPETNVSFDLIVREFPAIIDPPISTVARVGQSVTLNCTATGVPIPVVAWYREGVGLLPTASNTLIFAPIAPEDRGQYFCRVQNSLGNVTSELATISLEGLQQYIAKLTFGPRRRRQVENIQAGLIGRQLPDTDVEIYNVTRVDGTANATLLVTLTTTGDFPPGGVTDALGSEIVSVASAEGVQVTVEITRFDGCPMERGPIYTPAYPSLSIVWPESEIGQIVTANCACGSLNITDLNRQATRTCGGTYIDGGAWMDQNVTECAFSPVTLQLCVATEQAVDMQASRVADIVSNTSNIVTDTFSVASEILVNLLSGAVTNTNIRDNVFQSVESLLNANTEVAKESQINIQSGKQLLDALDSFTAAAAIPSGQSNLMYTQDSFSIVAEQVAIDSFQGRTFGTSASGSFESSSVQTIMGTGVPENSVASLTLPESLFNEINITRSETRLTFAVFSRDTFFQSRVVPREFASQRVGAPILSAALPGYDVSGLTTPISIRFEKSPSLSAMCVFWDPNLDSGFGQFSDEGCSTDDRGEETLCTCDHLTSFTILVTTSPTQPITQPTTATATATAEAVEDDADHSAVVFILLSISLVLLILTVVTHLVSKSSRSSEEGKILICYSITLAVLYFIVMLAYGENMPQGACRLWAFLLVYCFTAALLWGLLEALYILLRQQLPSYGGGFFTKNLVWIAMPIIWIVPLIFAFVSLAGLEYFGEKRICQVYNWPFYTFMVAPFIIIYAIDWFMYVTTLIKMTRSPSTGLSQGKFEAHRSALFHNFTAMILSLVFAIAWAFGFLASFNDVSRGAYLTGQYIFSFLTLIHTILLLVLPLLRTGESREVIKRLWYTITCRTRQYKFNETNAPTGRKVSYIANVEKAEEAITLQNVVDSGRHDEKVPLTNEVEGALPIETSLTHGEPPGVKLTGVKNLLADVAEDATTIANQSTLEASEDTGEKKEEKEEEEEEEDKEPTSHL